ncbi:collagen, type I, alpha 1b-like [Passer domesticus]|uniref:collagen, type I, alpha 1b-like n=1 Tax=Passer domesticus TaxID=48849 RepID=UPI0030FE9B3D
MPGSGFPGAGGLRRHRDRRGGGRARPRPHRGPAPGPSNGPGGERPRAPPPPPAGTPRTPSGDPRSTGPSRRDPPAVRPPRRPAAPSRPGDPHPPSRHGSSVDTDGSREPTALPKCGGSTGPVSPQRGARRKPTVPAPLAAEPPEGPRAKTAAGRGGPVAPRSGTVRGQGGNGPRRCTGWGDPDLRHKNGGRPAGQRCQARRSQKAAAPFAPSAARPRLPRTRAPPVMRTRGAAKRPAATVRTGRGGRFSRSPVGKGPPHVGSHNPVFGTCPHPTDTRENHRRGGSLRQRRRQPRTHACPLLPCGQAAGGRRRDGRGAATRCGDTGSSFRCGFAAEPMRGQVVAARKTGRCQSGFGAGAPPPCGAAGDDRPPLRRAPRGSESPLLRRAPGGGCGHVHGGTGRARSGQAAPVPQRAAADTEREPWERAPVVPGRTPPATRVAVPSHPRRAAPGSGAGPGTRGHRRHLPTGIASLPFAPAAPEGRGCPRPCGTLSRGAGTASRAAGPRRRMPQSGPRLPDEPGTRGRSPPSAHPTGSASVLTAEGTVPSGRVRAGAVPPGTAPFSLARWRSRLPAGPAQAPSRETRGDSGWPTRGRAPRRGLRHGQTAVEGGRGTEGGGRDEPQDSTGGAGTGGRDSERPDGGGPGPSTRAGLTGAGLTPTTEPRRWVHVPVPRLHSRLGGGGRMWHYAGDPGAAGRMPRATGSGARRGRLCVPISSSLSPLTPLRSPAANSAAESQAGWGSPLGSSSPRLPSDARNRSTGAARGSSRYRRLFHVKAGSPVPHTEQYRRPTLPSVPGTRGEPPPAGVQSLTLSLCLSLSKCHGSLWHREGGVHHKGHFQGVATALPSSGAEGCPPPCRSPRSLARIAARFPACRPGMSPFRMAQPTPAARRGHFSPHSPPPLPQPRSPPPAASSLSAAAADSSRPGPGVTMPTRPAGRGSAERPPEQPGATPR